MVKTAKTSSTKRKSKTFTISLPPELAAKAEAMATRESRTISELFREAFRAYWSEDIFRSLDDVRAYAASRNPHGYTEADIPRLIKEVRAEEAARVSPSANGYLNRLPFLSSVLRSKIRHGYHGPNQSS